MPNVLNKRRQRSVHLSLVSAATIPKPMPSRMAMDKEATAKTKVLGNVSAMILPTFLPRFW